MLNFQESTTISNACTKKVWKQIECTTYVCIYICIYIYIYNFTYIYIYIYDFTYIYIYVCVCIYIILHIYIYIYIYIILHKYVYIYISFCINMYIYIYIYHFAYIYIYIYIIILHKYVYIYIYIYLFKICIFWQHFFVNTNFIEHNRHFLSTYLLNPFVLPYCFYGIRQELTYVLSIVIYIPSTFCPTLGHYQRRIYY